MIINSAGGASVLAPPALSPQGEGWDADDWSAELDVSIVESGVAAEQLIRMTDDGCNSTCATACVSC